jgi:hypothetical protein
MLPLEEKLMDKQLEPMAPVACCLFIIGIHDSTKSARLMGFCVGLACLQAHAQANTQVSASAGRTLELVYIGTQGCAGPQESEGGSQGIYAARFDAKMGLSPLGLTVNCRAPPRC